MATKTILFESKRVGDAILAAQRLKSFNAARFDLEIYGPDDRRADEAIKKDGSLKKDLASACEKAFAKYKEEVGKFLSDQDKEHQKLSGDERKKFENRFSGPLYSASQAAFKKMESTALAETKKRWAKTAAGDPALKGVKFEAIVVSFLANFSFAEEAVAEEEEPEDFKAAKEVGLRITEAQHAIDGVEPGLKESIDYLNKAPGLIQSINATIDAVQKDYDAGPRESQKDDPDTDAEEEPDEGALNDAIYAEHDRSIRQADLDIGWVVIACTKAAGAAADAVKTLTPALKKIATSAKQENVPVDSAKELSKAADKLGAVLREFVAIGSEAKAAGRPLGENWAVIQALTKKKAGALGLLAKARIAVTPPTARMNAAVKLLREIKVAPSGSG